jgi:flagellin
MTLSVNTNSALNVLVNLNLVDTPQSQGATAPASTGTVSSASPSFLSVTQGTTSGQAGISLVQASLDRASSIADLASASGQSVADLLSQIKAKVATATDPSLSTAARTALSADFSTLVGQIGAVVSGASFDGVNLLNGASSADVKFLAGSDGSTAASLTPQDLTVGGPNIVLGADASIATPTAAAQTLAQVNQSLININGALSDLGTQAGQISDHSGFVSLLSNGAASATGDASDADGAQLQALQVQQQLTLQGGAIANAGPQYILSLFK